MMVGFLLWTMAFSSTDGNAVIKNEATSYDFIPAKSNEPKGIAKGIFPGRVVWAHDSKATKWKGNWKSKTDQYWLDENTDQQRVEAMLRTTLIKLTGKSSEDSAWETIFKHYNATSRGIKDKGYTEGEVIALKPNFNNSEVPNKTDNYSDESPQLILAMVRQLVYKAHVAPKDITIYDVRRLIPSYLLTKVWSEFKNVRFVQVEGPKEGQPKNPAYGDYHGLEANMTKHALSPNKFMMLLILSIWLCSKAILIRITLWKMEMKVKPEFLCVAKIILVPYKVHGNYMQP